MYVFWLCCVFIAECRFFSIFSAPTSHFSGFSCCRAQGRRASVAVVCGLRICGTSIQLCHGMWNLPRPGLNSCLLHGMDILNHWTNSGLQTCLQNRSLANLSLPTESRSAGRNIPLALFSQRISFCHFIHEIQFH